MHRECKIRKYSSMSFSVNLIIDTICTNFINKALQERDIICHGWTIKSKRQLSAEHTNVVRTISDNFNHSSKTRPIDASTGRKNTSFVNEHRAWHRYHRILASSRTRENGRNYIVSTAGVPDPRNARRSVIYSYAA